MTQAEITETVRDAGSSFIIPSTLAGKVRFLFNMAQIAYADGEIDITERDLLRRYVSKMEFADENIEGIVNFLLDAVKNGITEKEILQNVTI